MELSHQTQILSFQQRKRKTYVDGGEATLSNKTLTAISIQSKTITISTTAIDIYASAAPTVDRF
jgi:hypothetical protein